MKKGIKNYITEDSLTEILEYHPNWFVKWGVTIIAVFVLLLIFASMFIDEPEVLKSKYEFTLKKGLYEKEDSSIISTNNIEHKIYIDVIDKNKISKGKKLELLLISNETVKDNIIECIVDSIKYNPELNKYELIISVISPLNNSVVSEIMKKGIIKGETGIIIDKKSLFKRIFSKYIELNRL